MRAMARVFIAFGSNIAPEANVARALDLLAEHVRATGVSTVYRTEPLGRPKEEPFLNGALLIQTDLGPRTLKFEVLRGIEKRLGRVRTADRHAARPIDLDIALYADRLIAEPGLQLPDPDILARAFLAIPLAELAPEMILPGTDDCLADIASRFSREGMAALPDFTILLRKRATNGPPES